MQPFELTSYWNWQTINRFIRVYQIFKLPSLIEPFRLRKLPGSQMSETGAAKI